MKNRKHHNNSGQRQIKTGKAFRDLEHMAKRIFFNKIRKVGNKLLIEEKN